jgi:uncharacterized damage-inducible protein DinB
MEDAVKIISAILLLSLLFIVGQAQTAETAPATGFVSEYLYQLDEIQKKMVSLAEAVPAEKFSWRPEEGVRSISEVYMHVAGANFLLPRFIGVNPPGGLPPDMEKTVTDKARVIEVLKQSFDHIRQAVSKLTNADLEKRVKYFGRETTVRDVLFSIANHCHEHLGQSIAYARTNGVTPPWTASAETSQ